MHTDRVIDGSVGSAYIFRHKQLRNEHKKHMSSHTDEVLSRHRARFERPQDESPVASPVVGQMSSAWSSGCISTGGTNRRHVVDHASREIRDALHLARREHMSEMDALVSRDGHDLHSKC
jgi:5'-nucleotidase